MDVREMGRSGSVVSYDLGGSMPSGQVNANLRLDGCTVHGAEIIPTDEHGRVLRVTVRVPGRTAAPPGGYSVRVRGSIHVRGCSGDQSHGLERVENMAAGDGPVAVLVPLDIPLGYRPDCRAGTTAHGDVGFEYVGR
ncbi:hypothetical protein IBTHAUMO2_1050008 [Nitrosopumilaceae archaeon]|nr:hypothetical protein IBTHAUMO2_1050008 [Nitrosopumilaceae archaeon]